MIKKAVKMICQEQLLNIYVKSLYICQDFILGYYFLSFFFNFDEKHDVILNKCNLSFYVCQTTYKVQELSC